MFPILESIRQEVNKFMDTKERKYEERLHLFQIAAEPRMWTRVDEVVTIQNEKLLKALMNQNKSMVDELTEGVHEYLDQNKADMWTRINEVEKDLFRHIDNMDERLDDTAKEMDECQRRTLSSVESDSLVHHIKVVAKDLSSTKDKMIQDKCDLMAQYLKETDELRNGLKSTLASKFKDLEVVINEAIIQEKITNLEDNQ